MQFRYLELHLRRENIKAPWGITISYGGLEELDVPQLTEFFVGLDGRRPEELEILNTLGRLGWEPIHVVWAHPDDHYYLLKQQRHTARQKPAVFEKPATVRID